MTDEQVQLLKSLVDLQPIYNVLPILKSPSRYPPETVAFVRMKLKDVLKDLRSTAKHLAKELEETT